MKTVIKALQQTVDDLEINNVDVISITISKGQVASIHIDRPLNVWREAAEMYYTSDKYNHYRLNYNDVFITWLVSRF